MEYYSENWLDTDNNPAGGSCYGNGFSISWQNGKLVKNQQPNGAEPEIIVKAVIDRLSFLQSTKSACDENDHAIGMLKAAMHFLNTCKEQK